MRALNQVNVDGLEGHGHPSVSKTGRAGGCVPFYETKTVSTGDRAVEADLRVTARGSRTRTV